MGGWPSELNARTWIAEHRQKPSVVGGKRETLRSAMNSRYSTNILDALGGDILREGAM